ncbi:MAG: hypothetical protein JSU65_12545 [Candidatus Zixiibacteriota bacterium]|nr:MAG: hypothetical protein JSU65_12545 [candidate division Zixibacteria bacterium]
MRKMELMIAAAGFLLIALAIAGCNLVSGTFVIVENFEVTFTADGGSYWYPLDLASNPTWSKHQAEIDKIESIGFSFNIEDTSGVSSTFNVLFAAETGPADPSSPPTSMPSDTVRVIDSLAVNANELRTVSYVESLGMISNQADLKRIVRSGRFDWYGFSTGGTGSTPFLVTKGKIIIVVSGG